MEKKTKMNLSFITSHFKEKRNRKKETIRHVFANARAGNKVFFYFHNVVPRLSEAVEHTLKYQFSTNIFTMLRIKFKPRNILLSLFFRSISWNSSNVLPIHIFSV